MVAFVPLSANTISERCMVVDAPHGVTLKIGGEDKNQQL
jgi:hypothetical protein